MEARDELLRPRDQAPLAAEPIYKDFPTLIGGPHHGEPVPLWALNRSHLVAPIRPEIGYFNDDGSLPDAEIRDAVYTWGKFASAGSRRVLRVMYYMELSEDERSALTWHAILDRANLT